MMKVEVVRPIIRDGLVTAQVVDNTPEISELFRQSDTNSVELNEDQVNAFNRLLPSPSPPSFSTLNEGRVPLSNLEGGPQASVHAATESQTQTVDTVQCPKCKQFLRSTAQFCDNCGVSLNKFNAPTLEEDNTIKGPTSNCTLELR